MSHRYLYYNIHKYGLILSRFYLNCPICSDDNIINDKWVRRNIHRYIMQAPYFYISTDYKAVAHEYKLITLHLCTFIL